MKLTYAFGFLAVLIIIALVMPIPEPLFRESYATVLESREGQLLGAKIAGDEQWRFPPLSSLPPEYQKSLLQFEDRHFFLHPGINPVSLVRAFRLNVKAGKIVSGGSTITMQVARMAMGNKPRTVWQKLNEIWLALRLEVRFSKEEILLLYANNAPFGGNVVGLSAASWRYYGRTPSDLSWAETANLVVLPNAPGLIFPGKNDETLKTKRNRLLEDLHIKNVIDPMTLSLSKDEPVPDKPLPLPRLAPHLLDRIIKDGLAETEVTSTLDYTLQQTVFKIVNNYHDILQFNQIHNAAALVADISTGEVRAYIGNVPQSGNFDHGNEVDIISSKRSPGSLLKPFLYAMAIDDGIQMPAGLLPDIPIFYQGFAPKNFDKQFRGAVPANIALRSSLNVPFVSLLREFTYEKFYYNLKNYGINSLNMPPGHYGLSIILGGGEVTLWEMTGFYASLVRSLQTFNNLKGTNRYYSDDFRNLTYLSEKSESQNNPVAKSPISAGAIWHTLKALQELRRPDAESNWQQFANSKAIAWKTGTSFGLKDAWAIGLNDNYVVGVWLGNADGEGRPELTGVTIAAPLMFRIFEVLDGAATFPMPVADMEMMRICKQSGMKAGDICPNTELKPIAKSAGQTQSCQAHKYLFLDESEKFMVNASCYPVQNMVKKPWFILPPSQAWYYRKYNIDYINPPALKPECQSMSDGMLEMIYPTGFTKVYVPIEIDGKPGKVVFEAAHRSQSTTVFWYLDDEYLGETTNSHQMGLYPPAGHHTLHLVDDMGIEVSVKFEAINESKASH
ncbi:MAG: penicillin-binding protein 1C [Cyclobacteriaceae bacterium]|nr:penicillin-binding protein 1C [Cyclobacteriaceae bacterium]